jgi:uncharacterized protein (TIGR02598 family)
MKPLNKKAFSLIEVVIALGIFAFCIIGIFALFPIALNSVRTVKNTNNAYTIAGLFDSIWSAATPALIAADTAISYPGIGDFRIGSDQIYYFDDYGRNTDSQSATLRLDYTHDVVTINGLNLNKVTMQFIWPPNSAEGSPLRVNRFITNYYAQ